MRFPCLLPLVLCLIIPSFAASNGLPYLNQPLVPSTRVPGSTSFTMKVYGSGFSQNAQVNWNGVALFTTFVSHDELKAFVPGSNVGIPGTSMVSVTNPGPGGGTSNAVPFTTTLPTASLTFNTSAITVGTSVTAIAVGDFNNDGKMDLAVANEGAGYSCEGDSQFYYISILLGNGNGTFTAGGSIELGCMSEGLGSFGVGETVGDFNGDGRLDLALLLFSGAGPGPTIAVYLGNGDGTFAPSPSSFLQGYDFLGPVIAGDFNSDGKLDLAFPANVFGSGGLYVLPGNGDGTFAASPLIFFGSPSSQWLAEGDFNGDGILDAAGALLPGQPVSILLGNGDGRFSPASTQPAITVSGPMVTGDFNGDGILDLAFPGLTLLGNGDGTFREKDGVGALDAVDNNGLIAAADFNGDGKLDLAEIGQTSISIYLGNGDGTFQTPLEIPENTGPSQLAVGDFSGEGRLDIAVVSSGDNTVSLLLQSPAASLSSTSLSFAAQRLGTQSRPQGVTLTNSGSARMHILSIVSSGDFAEANTCGSFQTIGHTCQIEIYFRPTETGFRTGEITITDDAADSPQVITLSGTGK